MAEGRPLNTTQGYSSLNQEEQKDPSPNLKNSRKYFINEGGQKLHVRNFLPKTPNQCQAVVIWLHGFCGHTNHPPAAFLGAEMAKRGVAWLAYDQIGHGYSEGDRALVEDHNFLVDDAIRFVDLTIGSRQGRGMHLGLSSEFLARFREIPFFIAGESMGGAIAVITCIELQRQMNTTPMPNFAGALLVAPAIEGSLPPAPIVFLLEHCCLRCCPKSTVPDWIETVYKPDLVWIHEEDKKRVEADSFDKGGLGWGNNTRLRSGFSLIQMLKECQSILDEVAFPFYIIHDPDDGIVPFTGSKSLQERSATALRDGVIQEIPGGLHDLVSNKTSYVAESFYRW
eukprot:CAMPEP_0117751994 /NCGR_PEP_ID=MMETSP0947-20121206/11332_1 /TAXON_ID=44440 /ORGANISM="Chattonella subsalsa, Strain CCMP2191" /LENGTH=339 /DNA_ID=CAMNT_0005570533 /DNA_START=1 /DNA_END=1017 /DNA_ORIENTATION=-